MALVVQEDQVGQDIHLVQIALVSLHHLLFLSFQLVLNLRVVHLVQLVQCILWDPVIRIIIQFILLVRYWLQINYLSSFPGINFISSLISKNEDIVS